MSSNTDEIAKFVDKTRSMLGSVNHLLMEAEMDEGARGAFRSALLAHDATLDILDNLRKLTLEQRVLNNLLQDRIKQLERAVRQSVARNSTN